MKCKINDKTITWTDIQDLSVMVACWVVGVYSSTCTSHIGWYGFFVNLRIPLFLIRSQRLVLTDSLYPSMTLCTQIEDSLHLNLYSLLFDIIKFYILKWHKKFYSAQLDDLVNYNDCVFACIPSIYQVKKKFLCFVLKKIVGATEKSLFIL